MRIPLPPAHLVLERLSAEDAARVAPVEFFVSASGQLADEEEGSIASVSSYVIPFTDWSLLIVDVVFHRGLGTLNPVVRGFNLRAGKPAPLDGTSVANLVGRLVRLVNGSCHQLPLAWDSLHARRGIAALLGVEQEHVDWAVEYTLWREKSEGRVAFTVRGRLVLLSPTSLFVVVPETRPAVEAASEWAIPVEEWPPLVASYLRRLLGPRPTAYAGKTASAICTARAGCYRTPLGLEELMLVRRWLPELNIVDVERRRLYGFTPLDTPHVLVEDGWVHVLSRTGKRVLYSLRIPVRAGRARVYGPDYLLGHARRDGRRVLLVEDS